MSVLVTGGAGYIGGHMVLGLLDAGEKRRRLDNLSTGFAWAVPDGAKLVVGDFGDSELIARLIEEHEVDAIAHFAAKIVVPESVARSARLLPQQHRQGAQPDRMRGQERRQAISSSPRPPRSTARPAPSRSARRRRSRPISPYGRSKLMVEWMLEDAARAYDFRYVALRYFNVAGADPKGRLGQSTPNATHLIKRGVQTALGRHAEHGHLRRGLSDARRHLRARLHPGHRPHRRASRRARLSARAAARRACAIAAMATARRSRRSIEVVKRVSGRRLSRSTSSAAAPAIPPRSSPGRTASATCSAGGRSATISTKSSVRRSTGSGGCITGRDLERRAALYYTRAANGLTELEIGRRPMDARGRAAAMSGDDILVDRRPEQVLRRFLRRLRRRSQRAARLDPRADRPQRRGQDDLLQHADQVPQADARDASSTRASDITGDAPGRRRAARPRALVPDLGGVSASDRARKRAHRLAAQARRQFRFLALEARAQRR